MKGGKTATILKVAKHPKYLDKENQLEYDFAVVEIEPVNGIEPIRINPNFIPGGEVVEVIGFGARNVHGNENPKGHWSKLRRATLVTARNKQCKKQYGKKIIRQDIHLCAGAIAAGHCLRKSNKGRIFFMSNSGRPS